MHLYNATAPVMRRVVLGLDEDGIVDLAVRHARLMQQLAAAQPGTHWTFQYSPEMFSGTELAFSKRVVDAVTHVWQPTPAAQVHHQPAVDRRAQHAQHLCRHDRMDAPPPGCGANAIVLSVHPHNDRGTGTAAGEFAVMAGADRLEGCLFGNGERTGNLDIVNIALNLYSQGVSPGLDFSNIDEIRACVEHCNQLPVHPRHPYVGELVYTSFSGSHQDAIKKALAARREGDIWDMPYLPIDPKDLGRSYEAVIRVNSQSGKGGISYLLETEYGIELPRRLQIEFSQVVQAVMDVQGREMSAADIWRVFESEYRLDGRLLDSYRLDEVGEGRVRLNASLHVDGQPVGLSGQGNGPVDAFAAALQSAFDAEVQVLDYHEHAIGSGAKARAAAYIEMRVGDRRLHGVGVDADIVAASFKALLSGMARAQALRSAVAESPLAN